MLTAGFCRFIGIETWLYYCLFGFFSTMAVYNGQRLFKSKSLEQTPWLVWVEKNRKGLIILSVVSSVCAGLVLLQLPDLKIITLILLAFSGIISLLYVLKIRGVNMRQIPHLKIHLIAASWAAVLIAFPMLNESAEHDLFWPILTHYLLILALAIPFDIRDLKYDSPSQRTIPQVIGVWPSKLLAAFLLIAFGVLVPCFIDPYLLLHPMFFLSILLQIGLILFMNVKRSDLYCAGLIDGSIFLIGLSYFLY